MTTTEHDAPEMIPAMLWRAQLAKDSDELPAGVIGRVSGVACVYEVLDTWGTSFGEGCFSSSADRIARGEVKLFLDHGDVLRRGSYDTHHHIGTVRSLDNVTLPDGRRAARMTADVFDTAAGREAYEYLRAVAATGSHTGLSVGGEPAKWEVLRREDDVTLRWTDVPLWEISVTAMAAVPGAVVELVRQRALRAAAPAPTPEGEPAAAAAPASVAASAPESSAVSVPASASESASESAAAAPPVPVASSAVNPGHQHVEVTRMTTQANPPAGGRELSVPEQIARMGQMAGFEKEAVEMIARGVSVDDAANKFLELRITRENAARDVPDMGEDEAKDYSIIRAINAQVSGDWSKAGLEREVHQRVATRLNRDAKQGGFFMSTRGLPVMVARTQLSAGTANKGGDTVADDMRAGDFIELLRNRTLVMGALGARMLSGLVGDVVIPRQTAEATAAWGDEAPANDVSESSLNVGQLTMTPRTLNVHTKVSKQLLVQSSLDVEQLIRMDIVELHAAAIDRASLQGTGTASPTGVIYDTDCSFITFGTHGGTFSLAKVLQFEKQMEDNNVWNASNPGWVSTTGVKADLRARVRISSSDSRTLWERNEIEGIRAFSTNNMPSNLTKGTSTTVCHAAILADWRQLLIGEWGAQEIVVDPYTLAARNLVRLISYQIVDIKRRQPKAFVVGTDIIVS